MSKLFCFCVGLNLFFGRTRCEEVQQISSIFAKEKDNVTIQCSHNNNNLQNMLWYQQKSDRPDFHLITYAYGTSQGNNEDGFKERFTLNKESALKGSLTISALLQSDSAVYYCAASRQGASSQAYFGDGTKLTVLDASVNITPPNVKVLNVSEAETCAKKNVTLVCVASGFYPDHVTVYWDIDGENRTTDVSTDETAIQGTNKMYSISSRLNIFNQEEWAKGKTFTCTVSFFNGTSYIKRTASITGPKDNAEENTEKYVRTANTTMLAYGMFVAKSFAYGFFILVIIRKQGFISKQRR